MPMGPPATTTEAASGRRGSFRVGPLVVDATDDLDDFPDVDAFFIVNDVGLVVGTVVAVFLVVFKAAPVTFMASDAAEPMDAAIVATVFRDLLGAG